MHPAGPPELRPPRPPTGRGICIACGRDRVVLASGVVVHHDWPTTRRTLSRLERRNGISPIVRHGTCPGSHQKPAPPEEQP
jgi:hypothetical protein